MNREELKRHCVKQIEECERWAKYKGEEPHGKIYEEHKLILALIEQEPCEDCVSREAVKDGMIKCGFHSSDMTITEFVEDVLPPVTQETRWIPVNERLPEEDEEVLGTDLYDDLYKTYTWNDCGKIKWYADGNFDVPIVAWMPLPKMNHTGREE